MTAETYRQIGHPWKENQKQKMYWQMVPKEYCVTDRSSDFDLISSMRTDHKRGKVKKKEQDETQKR